ncbi:helix-turn-helix domain-containing protein [Aquimarina gracilis]|uniref:Helix-turn-helix domain-containing protein n=1 Tax=Aquimarina gracilis TaxID=874422 RepID=A0ABU5ZSS0_9FLAO|nr:helix-turn-helix domain-containing protein [Aquimarina gracilis]MEB3344326.1 helix-turn-helix domain-containing protein [Aquimarina gracilis]
MNGILNNIKKDFTISPNKLINNNNISDRARFLFVYMSSKPSDWTFYNYQLSKALGYSVDTLRKYIKELVETGWVVKEKQKRISGKFTANTYILYSKPQIVLPCRKNTGTVKNGDGKNPTLSNKEFTNTIHKKKKDFNSLKKKNNKRGNIIK